MTVGFQPLEMFKIYTLCMSHLPESFACAWARDRAPVWSVKLYKCVQLNGTALKIPNR